MPGSLSVDIHAHYFPESFIELMEAEGRPFGAEVRRDNPEGPVMVMNGGRRAPMPRRFTYDDERLQSMDEQHVDVHVLSLSTPMTYWAGPDLSLRLSQVYNDACAAAHEAHPARLYGFATLPMNSPDLALQELERASSLPGMRGVYMATRIIDKELSDESFFPIYEKLEELDWPIFLHPVYVVDPKRLQQYYLTNFIGNPTESAIAASHFIFGGVLDRFPTLTVCLPHAGGTFPYLIGRITHGWGVRPECQHLKTSPEEYLRRFYYDTITHSHPALDYVLEVVGPDRVMLGSDYCFDMAYDQPVEFVNNHVKLSDADRELILSGNAKRLLGL